MYLHIIMVIIMENRTTIQISEELRKKLKILASIRDISYEELLNEMIEVFKEIDKNKTIISIPKNLAEKIKKEIKEGSDFKSLSDYITFVLREVVAEVEEEEGLTDEDEEKIKDRLRSLGYLD